MPFYYFSHFLQVWILPPGLNLVLVLFGWILLHYSKQFGNLLIITAFVTLWLFSTPMVAQLLIDQLQDQYPPLQIDRIAKQSSSAIIVLGGGHEVYPESKNGYLLSSASEFRLRYAAHLYHRTHFPIIVSGGAAEKNEPSEAELMNQEMRHYFNVPVAWKENKSINTRNEGNYTLPILEKHKITTVYLVTDAIHMPRAMYTFTQSFAHTNIKIIATPMGYSVLQPDQKKLNFLPSLEGLNNSTAAIHEFIGLVVYHFVNIF